MAKDYDSLSEDEQELHEAMKAPQSEPEPEAEPSEQESKTPPRGPDGKFAKAEPEPEEAPEEGEKAEPEASEQDKRYVPLDALHQEREKHKDSRAELAELRQQLQQLQQMVQQPQPQPEAPEEPPDPLVDKAGYDAYWHKKLAEVSKPLQEHQQHLQQQQQYQSAVQQLQQYAAEHEQKFRKEYGDRDYDGALNFMRERTRKNLALMGVPDGQLDQVLAQEEMKLTATAWQQGKNPAALVYNMALNSGFQPQSEAAAGQPSEADKVRRLGEAQKQTKSTSGVSGAAREDEITLEQLSNKSQQEIARLTDKDPDLVRRLLGG